ncbi:MULTISPECIES: MrcB family domain-containing protein [Pacificibacter]|uniref:MrcB family domain-containing protein n=1 Tax=Pacificibacter TaxID=1042323 RepID=UPI001C095EC6|nr:MULTISPECIES: DUF3578 domain-containing protein [Pacificibacter]MBU2936516.1 DUF3578 domain-containing protein [Pacificibacter marinus]MDO6614682.1 DUF3578 domain-containing protein [Pacificibacter sp. 1_MG-2023]
MSLSKMLNRVANEMAFERGKPFSNSDFGNFVRRDLVQEAKRHLSFWPFDLELKASVGNGQWAAVPWLAFFDPLITTTATKGFYVVYLINAQDNSIFLSMNQGTTAVYEEFGRRRGREVMKRRSIDMSDRVADLIQSFSRDPIDLGSTEDLPAGYEAGHAFGKRYASSMLSEDECLTDLREILHIYEVLVNRGGLTPSDVMASEVQGQTIEETRKLVLSQRIERSSKVRRAVLAVKPPKCEACGLMPEIDYSFDGRPEQIPLDVHHSKPLFELAEGEAKRYRVPEDFLVLCPSCHRMIHKMDNPSDLGALKRKIRFKHMREVY